MAPVELPAREQVGARSGCEVKHATDGDEQPEAGQDGQDGIHTTGTEGEGGGDGGGGGARGLCGEVIKQADLQGDGDRGEVVLGQPEVLRKGRA